MDRKLKLIIVGSIITAAFIFVCIFLVSNFIYKNRDNLNPRKSIELKGKNVEIEKENRVNIEIRRENKNTCKLKKFQSDDSNNVNMETNIYNERRSNGDFYIDNINDLYNFKLVTLDEMFLIEKRVKEATTDMPRLYKETSNIKNDDKALSSYIRKNKCRLNYLYGIEKQENLKKLILKFELFDNNKKIKYGIINNMEKHENRFIEFYMSLYYSSNSEQSFKIKVDLVNNMIEIR
ncbi:hypothetical protein [Clostridium felsineum]|uniref:hypothetical protein n=1 Tax=Clostridium felsineum TaxID=36839 RepID=UPI00098C3F2A|nr:hypothetical protein [Clostridium felsineum]URZ16328.1 hypothetical protein CLFE_023750 [Clostridium felsineum DSM 794]